MRAWVFSEEMLSPALARWAAQAGGEAQPDVAQRLAVIREFLDSDAAAKLRVPELDHDRNAAG